MDQATHSKIVSFLCSITEQRAALCDAQSFTCYFYQPKLVRTLEEIRADILAGQNEAEGLPDELVHGASK